MIFTYPHFARLISCNYYPTVTGLENGAARENVIIWSLAENRSLCCIPVPQQVAVIKLSYPDIVICGHLDGFTTKIYLNVTIKYTKKSESATSSSYNPQHEPSVSRLDFIKEIFRAHTSAVISLDVDKVREYNYRNSFYYLDVNI